MSPKFQSETMEIIKFDKSYCDYGNELFLSVSEPLRAKMNKQRDFITDKRQNSSSETSLL
jgi:hypothetical protein